MMLSNMYLLTSRVLSQSTGGTAANSCSPCFTWTDHALPVTDIHCGYGGMQAHVATSSLDQTCKVQNSIITPFYP